MLGDAPGKFQSAKLVIRGFLLGHDLRLGQPVAITVGGLNQYPAIDRAERPVWLGNTDICQDQTQVLLAGENLSGVAGEISAFEDEVRPYLLYE